MVAGGFWKLPFVKTTRPQKHRAPAGGVLRTLLLLFFGRGGGLGGLRLGEALLEFVHAAGGVHELLLAGVKWVAGVANADNDSGFGGTRLDHVTAGATDFRIRIFRMNVCFHKKGAKLSRTGRMTRRNIVHHRFTCGLAKPASIQNH
jgi:hypothetical protein